MPVRLPSAAALPKCPSCTAHAVRPFTHSAVRLAVGPESPRYIDVPQPPQQTVPDKTRLKGILPVPRDIFAGTHPQHDGNVHLSTKEPVHNSSHHDQRIAWKERMAASRRKNLREGLHALKDRRVKSDSQQQARAQFRQNDRNMRLNRPEPDDERLTNPSVDPSLTALLQRSSLPDPHRNARLAEMRRRTQEKDAMRQDQRRDALHSLYINARNFIVTEAQLNKEIDNVFGTVENPHNFGGSMNSPSIWADGSPETVQDMLGAATGQPARGGALASSGKNSGNTLTKDRIQRMAEELTGGRIVSDASRS